MTNSIADSLRSAFPDSNGLSSQLVPSLNESDTDLNQSYLSAAKPESVSGNENLSNNTNNSNLSSNSGNTTNLSNLNSMNSQHFYFSMITHTILLVLLFVYSLYRLSSSNSQQYNNQNHNSQFTNNFNQNKIKSQSTGSAVTNSLAKLSFLFCVIFKLILLVTLLTINLPINSLESGGVLSSSYRIKISREYLDGIRSTRDGVIEMVQSIVSKITSNKDKSEKGLEGYSGNQFNEPKTIENKKEGLESYPDGKMITLSLVPLLYSLLSLSNLLLISTVLLVTLATNQKSMRSRVAVLSYGVLRVPLLFLIDYNLIRKESAGNSVGGSLDTMLFGRSVFYGLEGYICVGVVIAYIFRVLNNSEKEKTDLDENTMDTGLIVTDKISSVTVEKRKKSDKGDLQSYSLSRQLYVLSAALLVYVFVTHTVHILSLPVRISDTALFFIDQVGRISWLAMLISLVEVLTN